MTNTIARLDRSRCGLLIVDIQERLLPAIHEKEPLLENAVRLARGAGVFGLPIFVTEQYRRGLGTTVPELAASVHGYAPIEKLTFSACGAPGLLDEIRGKRVHEIILCGIEAHVCVCQTCLDLLSQGVQPFVVVDAVSSRTPANRQAGLDRMREAGAILVSTEMVLFELLARAGTDEFKQILTLVK